MLSAAAFDSFQTTADGVNTHAPIERRKQTHKLKTKRLNNTDTLPLSLPQDFKKELKFELQDDGGEIFHVHFVCLFVCFFSHLAGSLPWKTCD